MINKLDDCDRQKIALSVLQEGISKLAKWVDVSLPEIELLNSIAIDKAKQILSWSDTAQFKPLALLFDSINPNLKKTQNINNYLEPIVIDNQQLKLPIPVINIPDLKEIKEEIKKELSKFKKKDLDNISLLNLCLEKLGSYISFDSENIAFYDTIKSIAMVAVALSDKPESESDKPKSESDNHEPENVGLIAGDLSGIQNFIYTISADGALKSLRARSFFLELVTEEITQQLLTQLQLPRTNIIYSGAGNIYILTNDNQEENQRIINQIKSRFNDWFSKDYQGKMFLALDYLNLPVNNLNNEQLSQDWQKISEKLSKQKQQKFSNQLNDFLKPQPSYEPCKVCNRDDLQTLKPINSQEPDSSPACEVCCKMFELGSFLFKAEAIVRVKKSKNQQPNTYQQIHKIDVSDYEYYLFDSINKALSYSNSQNILLINNWNLSNYKNEKIQPILLGNHGQEKKLENESGFMRTGEMTEIARESGTIPRVAYLRMDVDNLGQIFAKGLGKQQNISRLGSLSRQINYFFKVYLNSLASTKDEKNKSKAEQENESKTNYDYDLLFIYAGGDDLFISGVWSDVVEFAFKIYQSFRDYTGNNPSITLSAGISLASAKYPLYQSANESGEAETNAKANGRDSLSLFGEVFKWQEWQGKKSIKVCELDFLTPEVKEYLGDSSELALFGIKTFVDCFQSIKKKDGKDSYSRNFVQNLLATAKIQEQKIKELETKRKTQIYDQEIDDIKYFLHLPKIAYTLARLPSNVKNNPLFEDVNTSLKSPYNAPYYKAIATWLELLNRSQ